jgi:hypothetical protein
MSEAVEIYKKILNKELDRFPNGYWKDGNSKLNAKEITKYLIEDLLRWDGNKVKQNLQAKIFRDNKLSGMLEYVFGRSPYKAINNAYPEEYKPWEFRNAYKGIWDKQENIEDAIRWLLKKVRKDKFNELTNLDFLNNGLGGLLDKLIKEKKIVNKNNVEDGIYFNERVLKIAFDKSRHSSNRNIINPIIKLPPSWLEKLEITEENNEIKATLEEGRIILEPIKKPVIQKSSKLRNKRIGSVNYNKYGSRMVVVDYKCPYVTVKFDNGYITKTIWVSFKGGTVKNPYDKSVYGMGYLGEGKYNTGDSRTYDFAHIRYRDWKRMLRYCLKDVKPDKNIPINKNEEVCLEWLNFQNFAKWYDENYYPIAGQTMHINNNIIKPGNKIYSPDTCLFVPRNIDRLFSTNKYNLPQGIGKHKNKYSIQHKTFKERNITKFGINSLEEAIGIITEIKINELKELVDKYKNEIPANVLEILINVKRII